jgi:hypothetical protein
MPEKTETRPIRISNNTTTLQTFLDNGKKKLGKSYYKYDAHYNNCQDYLVALLTSNGWGSAEDLSWIKQDTGQLFAGNPYIGSILKGITNLGGIVDRIQHGAGHHNSPQMHPFLPSYQHHGY